MSQNIEVGTVLSYTGTRAQINTAIAQGIITNGAELHITDELPVLTIVGSGAPTTSTACSKVGDMYVDTTNSKAYVCYAIAGSVYTWGATGGSVSGTHQDGNWVTISIEGVTKNIPQGGGATYTAGDHINISAQNEISAVYTVTADWDNLRTL